jgi:hypothetical protein
VHDDCEHVHTEEVKDERKKDDRFNLELSHCGVCEGTEAVWTRFAGWLYMSVLWLWKIGPKSDS